MDDSPEQERPGTAGQGLPPSTARPVSRRRFGEPMTASRQRPDSRMGGGSGSGSVGGLAEVQQQRPMSRISRLQSAASSTSSRPLSSFRQGSALKTAGRPPSGMMSGGALPLHASVNVMDRPVTQQGVSGLRTARTGTYRMVHDKTYYLGLLHTKMSEIGTEISRLSTQVEALGKEQSTFIAYENRVKEKAAELQELNGELQDYNILSEMLSNDKDKLYLEEELKQLKKDNAADSERIELVYNRRRDSERQVAELEVRLEDERSKAHHLIESLSPQLRDKYETFQSQNSRLQNEMEKLQLTLDDLNSKKSELYDRICRSELKKKAAELQEELLEAQDKREALMKEAHSRETPEEERDRLMAQVKMDNAEMNTLERQIAELADQIRKAQGEIHSMEQEIEENDSERQQKFRELRKREQDIDDFMTHFEENKLKECEALNRIEMEIVNCLEKISRNIQLASSLPETGRNFMEIRDELNFKEDEFDKAKYTAEMIEYRNEALRKQLENFQNLKEKMKTELKALSEKMDEMQRDIRKFQDIEAVKTEGTEKLRNLQIESSTLEKQTKAFASTFRSVQSEHERLKRDLESNDVHRQLTSLEKKWVLLEEGNYSLEQFIAAKRAETDFEMVKENALTILSQLNQLLIVK